MCGILLHCMPHESPILLKDELIEYSANDSECSDTNPLFNHLVPYIASRGPDYSSFRVSKEHRTAWFSSVLSLRQPFTRQSIKIEDKYILQYNGELYNEEIMDGNDTQFIANLLSEPNAIADQVITSLRGEFAYTIYDLKQRVFYFGRDSVGKRSLSYKINDETQELFVSSTTGSSEGFINCVAGIIYKYDAKTHHLDTSKSIAEKYQVTLEIDDDEKNQDQIINNLYQVLTKSVEERVLSIHPAHIENNPISILFSGGLDCSVIVAMICEVLQKDYTETTQPIIELLNVGFENPRTNLMPSKTPDRLLGVESYKILQALYPNINLKLVEVDVAYDEYLKLRPTVIDLMYPKSTEMDLSIAIAFYFASRGCGFVEVNGKRVPYNRKGIVLFSGLGADELFGGYHKFANKPPKELCEELTRQINNIHNRNLNRDDKVIAANGVEVRYPFLDNSVIKFVTNEIAINYKVNKKILRRLATVKLNLQKIADEPKRAIQFGSKSAKMTKDGNKNGTDIIKT